VKLAVTWCSRARRELRRLDPQIRHRIVAAIERFAETVHGGAFRVDLEQYH